MYCCKGLFLPYKLMTKITKLRMKRKKLNFDMDVMTQLIETLTLNLSKAIQVIIY